MLGIDNIEFNLTISVFNPCNDRINDAVKSLHINIIQTNVQVLDERTSTIWTDAIRKHLSVKTIPNTLSKSNCLKNNYPKSR